MHELVTLVMPLKHYHPPYLRKAIDSIINQSNPNWCLLIVVEASDVATFTKALANDLTDVRIELVRNAGRKLAGAINTGMRQARTDFVALLLSDDMWSPEAVEVLHQYMARYPDADFFHSSRVVIDGHDNKISRVYQSKEYFRVEDFVFGSQVKHLLCWRKDKALLFGGVDETLDSVGPDDYDFPWSMAEKGARFVAIKECLYLYRDHRESYRLTTHLPLSVHIQQLREIMRKHGVNEARIVERIASARRSYLRQCLYKSRFHKWVKETLRYDPRHGWREKYK